MAVSYSTLTGDFSTIIAGEFVPSSVKAFLSTNLDPGQALIDLTNNRIQVGTMELNLSAAGVILAASGSDPGVSLIRTNSTDTNIDDDSLRYRVTFSYINAATRVRETWDSDYFELTADANLATIVGTILAPVTWRSDFITSMEALRDEAEAAAAAAEAARDEAVSIVTGDLDPANAALINDPDSETATALDASYAQKAPAWVTGHVYSTVGEMVTHSGLVYEVVTTHTAGGAFDAAKFSAIGSPPPADASTTVKGIVELATNAETTTGTDTVRAVTPAGVKAAIDALIAAAPGALDTLDELAAALGDDANFAATTATALAAKLVKANNLSDLANAGTARTNLGLGDAAVKTVGVAVGNVPVVQANGFLSAPLIPLNLPGPAYNAQAANWKRWRRALSRIRAGTASGLLACIGDSTTGGDGTSSYGQNYPSILTGLLNSYYVPAIQDWLGASGAVGHYDSRITLSGGWAAGGVMLGSWDNFATGDSTSTITYTATHNHDTIKIYWQRSSGWGSFTYTVDGGSPVTVSTAGATGIGITTISGLSLTTHTLVITKTTAGNQAVSVGHVRMYDSNAKYLSVMNAGINGAKATGGFAVTAAYGARAMITLIAADLAIIDLGKNDAPSGLGITQAAYETAMQNLINDVHTAGGDVLLKSMNPTGNSTYTALETAIANTSLPSLAVSNGCPYLDGYNRWEGNATTYSALGYYTDPLHPSPFGFSDIAQAVFNLLKSI